MKPIAYCLALLALTSATALGQHYKVLHRFAGPQPNDGAFPDSGVITDGAGNLFGTTLGGGAARGCPYDKDCGTVYELSPNASGGWSEAVIYSFCSVFDSKFCADGEAPIGGLAIDGLGNLYGTTFVGGIGCPASYSAYGCGTVFELSPPSIPGGTWTEKVLYNLCSNFVNNTCLDGSYPTGQLTLDTSGNIYGTTNHGGSDGKDSGTVFELSPNLGDWTYSVLYSFCSEGSGNDCPDGSVPVGGVTFDAAGNLYGTTEVDGPAGGGVVYRLSPSADGWVQTVLFAFSENEQGPWGPQANVSFDPMGSLYSTFQYGGPANAGGVFKLSPGNGGRVREVDFDGTDGSSPYAGLLISPTGQIYGTTVGGGAQKSGTVFKVGAEGRVVALHSFCQWADCSDGYKPLSTLVTDSAGNLYGTTQLGGSAAYEYGFGVVFEITP